MHKATVGITFIGIFLAILSCLGAFFKNKELWFSEAVYLSAAYIILSIAFLYGFFFLVTKLWNGKIMSIFIFCVMLTAIAVPNFYINTAVFFGAEQAEFSTWHLLPLFAAMYQCMSTVTVFIFSGICCSIFYFITRLKNAT